MVVLNKNKTRITILRNLVVGCRINIFSHFHIKLCYTLFFSFSLTLIDTLDTLVILGDFEEFEHGVKLVIKDVNFDNDIVVSVFETNIRIVG